MTSPAAAPADDRSDLRERQLALRSAFVSAGLLIETDVDGVYGRGGELQRVIDAVDAMVSAAVRDAHGGAAQTVAFPR